VNVKRFDGNTPLHIACGRGNVGMVALLMAGGADPDIENDEIIEVLEEGEEEDVSRVAGAGNGSSDGATSGVTRRVSKEDERAQQDEKETDTTAGEAPELESRGLASDAGGFDEVDAIRVPADPSLAVTASTRKESLTAQEKEDVTMRRGLIPADFADNNDKVME